MTRQTAFSRVEVAADFGNAKPVLIAFSVMVEQARQLGANAIVGIRYDASEVEETATEVLCYGTAVLVIPR